MRWLTLLTAAIAGVYSMKMSRGIRNNNPGNIRENDRVDYDWEGEAVADTDSEFEEFASPEYGIRAMVRILKSYRRRGVVSIEDVISAWAPASENDTEAYIESVANRMNLSRYHLVVDSDFSELIKSIISHENGSQPYSNATINNGIALA